MSCRKTILAIIALNMFAVLLMPTANAHTYSTDLCRTASDGSCSSYMDGRWQNLQDCHTCCGAFISTACDDWSAGCGGKTWAQCCCSNGGGGNGPICSDWDKACNGCPPSGWCCGNSDCSGGQVCNTGTRRCYTPSAAACTDPTYPSGSWDRVWCNKALNSKLGDTPDESSATFNNDWGSGTVANIRSDDIGFKSGRTINFPGSGTYRFTVGSDDGVRLWVDGVSKIDQLVDRGYTTNYADVYLAAGDHTFRIDYYESGGGARVSFSYTSPPCVNPSPPTLSSPANGAYLSGTQATLSWNAVAGATSYNVRVDDGTASDTSDIVGGTANNCSPHDVCYNGWTSTSMTVTMQAGKTYSWWVHAVNACGGSGASSRSFTVNSAAPTAYITGPTSLNVGQTGTYAATATDTDNNLEVIRIYSSPTSAASPGTWTLVGSECRFTIRNSYTCSQSWSPSAAGTYYLVTNAWDNSEPESSGTRCSGNPWSTSGWSDCDSTPSDGTTDALTVTVTSCFASGTNAGASGTCCSGLTKCNDNVCRSSCNCDDSNACTYGTVYQSSGSCGGGTSYTCPTTTCGQLTCDGSGGCTGSYSTASCGTSSCPANYCSGLTRYYYPATCTKYCSGGSCGACSCSASSATCTAGGCCTAQCSSGACSTTTGSCADSCGANTLTVSKTCSGCGASGATGTCSSGTSYTCDATMHTLCQSYSCGGSAYYCTNAGGSWAWRTSTGCDDSLICTHSDACSSGSCSGTSYTCPTTTCGQVTCDGSGGCTGSYPTSSCGTTSCQSGASGTACTRYCSSGTCGTCTPTCAETACSDRSDNDNDGACDSDSSCNTLKGDSDCPVGVTTIRVSDSNPVENTDINVWCASSPSGVNSISAYLDKDRDNINDNDELCTWNAWEGNEAKFTCNVGSAGAQTVAKTAKCTVQSTKSFQSGTDKTVTVNVKPSACSAYTASANCDADTRCDWCQDCEKDLSGFSTSRKYWGNSDACANAGSCDAGTSDYYCYKDKCTATCDATRGGCGPYISGDNCYYGSDCQASCSCSAFSSAYCPVSGTTSGSTCYYGTITCAQTGCSHSTCVLQTGQSCSASSGCIDTTAPTSDITAPDASSWHKEGFTVSITDADTGGSGLSSCVYRVLSSGTETRAWATRMCNSGISITTGPGNNCRNEGSDTCTVYAGASDVSGNAGTVTPRSFSIDWTVPITTIQCNSAACSNNWYTADVSVALTCTDASSGCDKTKYCVDQANTCTPTTLYSAAFTVSNEGTNYVRYFSNDIAGNVEAIKSTPIKIDKSGPPAPTFNPATRDWANTDVSVVVTYADPNGITDTKYCWSATTCTPNIAFTNSGTITQTANGNWQLCTSAKDSLGNSGGTTCSGSYRIDKTAPSGGSITNNNGYQTTTPIIIVVNRGSDAESGMSSSASDYLLEVATAVLLGNTCGSYTWSDAGVTESASATSYTYTGASGNCYKFRYTAKNNAGLSTTYTGTDVTKVDTSAPSGGSVSYTNGYETDTVARVAVDEGSDTESGITSVQLYVQSAALSNNVCGTYSSWSPTGTQTTATTYVDHPTASGNCYQFKYRSTNAAGLYTEYTSSSILKVDTSAPVGSLVGVPSNWQNTDASITLTCTDTGSSGCDNNADYYYLDTDSACPEFAATTYTAYTAPVAVSSHKWFCYSVADIAGSRATSETGTEIKVDKLVPTADVSGAPDHWVNTAQPASVSCADTGDSGCSSATYRLKIYDANPVTCSTTYADYTLTTPQTISSHKWVCAAAKDTAGNADYSSPEEFKIDAGLAVTASMRLVNTTKEIAGRVNYGDNVIGEVTSDITSAAGALREQCFEGGCTVAWKVNSNPLTTDTAWSGGVRRLYGISTVTYKPVVIVNATVSYLGKSRSAEKNATVNMPPVIANATASPSVIHSGDPVEFTANVTDDGPENLGIDYVRVCADVGAEGGACANQICAAAQAQGTAYACTGTASSDTGYVILAVDKEGAWSTSDGRSGGGSVCGDRICSVDETCSSCSQDCGSCSGTRCGDRACNAAETCHTCQNDCGPCGIDITLTNIISSLEYPAATSRAVRLIAESPVAPAGNIVACPSLTTQKDNRGNTLRGCPNITKTMEVDFIIRADISKQSGSNMCSGDSKAQYRCSVDVPQATALRWDPFARGWRGKLLTDNAACDSYMPLIATVTLQSTSESSLRDTLTSSVFVNCNPSIVVEPAERRVAVGQKNMEAFNVTIYDPGHSAASPRPYRLRMDYAGIRDETDIARNMLNSFECRGEECPALSQVPGAIDSSVVMSIPNNVIVPKKHTITISLGDIGAFRAGTYPFKFVAEASPGIEGEGTLMVFAEGLDEFAAWQIVLLLGIAAVVVIIYPHKRRKK